MKKLFIFGIAVLSLTACKKEESSTHDGNGTVEIEFDHQIGENSLVMGTEGYTFGENMNVKINTVKYYISNVVLTEEDGTELVIEDSYHLVDASKEESLLFRLEDVPSGTYDKISFMVGVDAPRNTEGAQEGALDPANGMFWSWNSGYIFLKLEGSYGETDEDFSYHIGGFEGEHASQQQVNIMLHGSSLGVHDDELSTVHTIVNLEEFFKNPTEWNIVDQPVMTMPGMHAKTISDNYADMFTVHHLHH
jgi:hypothetical protein